MVEIWLIASKSTANANWIEGNKTKQTNERFFHYSIASLCSIHPDLRHFLKPKTEDTRMAYE